MTDEEYQQYTAFLLPEHWEKLGELAKSMGIGSRQPLIRWAIIDFLTSKSSTYRSIKDVEAAEPTEQAA